MRNSKGGGQPAWNIVTRQPAALQKPMCRQRLRGRKAVIRLATALRFILPSQSGVEEVAGAPKTDFVAPALRDGFVFDEASTRHTRNSTVPSRNDPSFELGRVYAAGTSRASQRMHMATRAQTKPPSRMQVTAPTTKSTDHGWSPPPTRSRCREWLASRYVRNRTRLFSLRVNAMTCHHETDVEWWRYQARQSAGSPSSVAGFE